MLHNGQALSHMSVELRRFQMKAKVLEAKRPELTKCKIDKKSNFLQPSNGTSNESCALPSNDTSTIS